MTSGQSMRKCRRDFRLTLRELSQLSGVSITELSHIELDKHSPSLDTVILLADALGLTIDEYVCHKRNTDLSALRKLWAERDIESFLIGGKNES